MAASLAEVVQTPGTCFLCGCTESEPCSMRSGLPCSWIDVQQTVCSSCFWLLGETAVQFLLDELCGSRSKDESSRLVLP